MALVAAGLGRHAQYLKREMKEMSLEGIERGINRRAAKVAAWRIGAWWQ